MIIILLIAIGLAYITFILLSAFGWRRTKLFRNAGLNFKTQVSIIIPARNEEINILLCLDAIAQQSFPNNLTEIIVVDDDSEDNTSAVVKNWIDSHSVNAKIISVGNGQGKKNALNEAVKIASGELIVTTDADCTMGSEWLSTILNYYEKYSPSMIAGMISLNNENNFLSSFQSQELMGLTGIGAAGIYFNHPLLCNGANLAYTKKVFEESGGYNILDESASGDDTALMFRIAKENPSSVHFLKSTEAIVITNPVSSWSELMEQRKRWGSKVIGQKNKAAIAVAFLVFLFHFTLLLSFVLFAAGTVGVKIPLLLFGMKIIPEIIFLSDVFRFYGKQKLWKHVLPAQLIYPLYIIIAVLISQTGKYIWKGRRVK